MTTRLAEKPLNKVELLRQRAEKFHRLLEEYSANDSDVADFKRRFLPWYQKIMDGKIVPPNHDYRLGVYFTNPDLSPLADRYFNKNPAHPLAEAEIRFGEAIRDRLSDPAYLRRLRENGEEPSAVLAPMDGPAK